MLVALSGCVRVGAATAAAGDDYYCPDPDCGARVILKRGTRRIAHFAHVAASSCVLSQETLEHMQAKIDIANEYRRRGYSADVEVPVKSPVEDRRADVLVASPRSSSLHYAVEIQDSAIDERELWRRTRSYAAAGVRVVWIGLVRADKWLLESEGARAFRVRKYSPKLHERWIAAIAGELWLYDPVSRQFWHVVFADHMLERGGVNFIDVGLGEHIDIPAYEVSSARWVDAKVAGPWDLRNILLSANGKRPIGTLIGKKSDS